jgi:arsenical pump membrane protein
VLARAPAGGRWGLLAVGAGAAAASAVLARGTASAAASQTWPAFVLVAGLLLIGLVADGDGLFEAAGLRLAALSTNGWLLFGGVAVMVAVVTALLNLDTSVTFLTPVVVHAGRRRGGGDESALLVSVCLLVSNAGSLLLPGSNLTNLIVLGPLPLPGGTFFARMALPWAAAVLVTAGVVALRGRRMLGAKRSAKRSSGASEDPDSAGAERPVLGVGLAAMVAAVVLVIVLRSPAVPVLAVGCAAVLVRIGGHKVEPAGALAVLGLPVLAGLFGVAVGLGTAGRQWSWPSHALGHLDVWATGFVAAAVTVAVNNLPAAALLSARAVAHPYALLVGLNVGPNLFVTGSLAWFLWMRSARAAGGSVPVARTVQLGVVAVPLSMAASLGALLVTAPR